MQVARWGERGSGGDRVGEARRDVSAGWGDVLIATRDAEGESVRGARRATREAGGGVGGVRRKGRKRATEGRGACGA